MAAREVVAESEVRVEQVVTAVTAEPPVQVKQRVRPERTAMGVMAETLATALMAARAAVAVTSMQRALQAGFLQEI